jgi:NAD-dependent SIR2 family protein deacetylase
MIQLIDASVDAFKRQLRDRSIIWVGAGTSIAAGYPSAAGLVAALKQAADDPIAADDFPEATDQFVRSRGEAALRVLLQREIGGGRPLTDVHRSLARLAKAGHIHTVITTNYDDLIERTLSDHGVPFILQTFEANFEAAAQGTVRVMKVHGSYQDWSRVVLSGRSYARYAADYRRLGEQLNVLCRQYPMTFVGSSLLEPRVLGWLATLTGEERKNLLPWRAFLTLPNWNRLLEYKTRDFEARTLLVGQFRPLILKDHAALQTIWMEAARDLAAPESSTKAEAASPTSDIPEWVRSAVLLREAIKAVIAASYGAGPTTHLHRRLEAGERWIGEARKSLELISHGAEISAEFVNYLQSLADSLSTFAAKIKPLLPKSGELDSSYNVDDATKSQRHFLDLTKDELSKAIPANLTESTKWKILRFEDQESFDDFVYPRLAQLVRSNNDKVHALVRRLLKDPQFTPAGLASEGHRASIVMDVVNALMRENAAIWTDLSVLGARAKGCVTDDGRELLIKLMAESR